MLRRLSQENFEAVNSENADEADFTDLAGGQDFEVLGAGISCGGLVGECDAVVKMHDFARPFPKGDVYRVSRMKHCQRRCMVYCLCHYEKGVLNVSVCILSGSATDDSGRSLV